MYRGNIDAEECSEALVNGVFSIEMSTVDERDGLICSLIILSSSFPPLWLGDPAAIVLFINNDITGTFIWQWTMFSHRVLYVSTDDKWG